MSTLLGYYPGNEPRVGKELRTVIKVIKSDDSARFCQFCQFRRWTDRAAGPL